MSELINIKDDRRDFRWQLLTSVSSVAVVAFVFGMVDANASDSDRPTVWIELGGDLDRVDSSQQAFAPPFVVNNPGSTAFDPMTPAQAQRPPKFSFGGEGKLSFQPEESNWMFSASVRYGRSNGNRSIHQTAENKTVHNHLVYSGYLFHQHITSSPALFVANFLAVQEKQSESHAILDFQAGRDFGLGLFGREGTSVLNAGIRFAQFTAGMAANMQARPDLDIYARHYPNSFPFKSHVYGTFYVHHYHQYLANVQSARSFRGVGPNLSWNASAAFAGNSDSGELSFDWGANAALLFGRQKADVRHQTSAVYFAAKYVTAPPGYHHAQVEHRRARSIVEPNVGGFAGLTFSFPNFKASLGYRGDFFFGAMDTGFDTARKSTVGFYGPFATVSVGLGG